MTNGDKVREMSNMQLLSWAASIKDKPIEELLAWLNADDEEKKPDQGEVEEEK